MGVGPPQLEDPGPNLNDNRQFSLVLRNQFRDPAAPSDTDPEAVDDLVRRGRWIWILTIIIGGRSWRYSSEPIEIFDPARNALLPYDGGLAVTRVQQALSFIEGGGQPAPLQSSLSILWPAEGPQAAALVELQHDLGQGLAELSLIAPGLPFDQRARVIVGRLQGPTYGDADEAVSFTIAAFPWEETQEYPIPTVHTVGPDTWPEALPDHLGRIYPTVFGRPGNPRTGEQFPTESPGSECLVVDNDEAANNNYWLIMVSMDRITAQTVTLSYAEVGTEVLRVEGPLLVHHTRDGLGTLCACAWMPSRPAGINPDIGVWAYWTTDAGGVVSITAPNPPTALEAAGAGVARLDDLILWLMQKSSVQVDFGQSVAAFELMHLYEFDLVIDEPIKPWEFVVRQLLPHVPIAYVFGPAGVRFKVWDHLAQPADAVEHFVAGPGFERTTPVQTVRRHSEIMNQRSLSYGWLPKSRTFSRHVLLVPDTRLDLDDSDQRATAASSVSGRRYGLRAASASESAVLWDPATVDRILDWWSVRVGFSHRQITYVVPQGDAASVQVGDAVLLTDESIALLGVVGIVAARLLTDEGTPQLTFELIESPLVDPVIFLADTLDAQVDALGDPAPWVNPPLPPDNGG